MMIKFLNLKEINLRHRDELMQAMADVLDSGFYVRGQQYKAFCEEYGYTQKNGKPRATAEILTKYLEGDTEYQEEHTGLADVLIEKEITAQCLRQHKKMRKKCFN